jgi:site-specific recombinase XerD
MQLSEAREAFLSSIVGVRSPNTVVWYKHILLMLDEHFSPDQDISTIRLVDLEAWRTGLFERRITYVGRTTHPEIKKNLSPITIYGAVKSVRTFFKWLKKRGYLSENPAIELQIPKKTIRKHYGVSEATREKMILFAKRSRRNLALLMFVFDTACRRGGVSSLKMCDLNLDEYHADILEKGSETRTVYFGEETAKALRCWLEIRHLYAVPGVENVFVSTGGHTPGHAISPIGITEIFRQIAITAGIEEQASPHQWRHASSRSMIRNGMPISVLSQILGHKDSRVTLDYYSELDQSELQGMHKRFSPMNGNNHKA